MRKPLEWAARSRARLVVCALVAAGGQVGVSIIGGRLLWLESHSVVANFLVTVLWMGLLALFSYVEALLLGDLLLPGAWRERTLLGKIDVPLPRRDSADASADDDDAPLEPGGIKKYTVHFSLILTALIAGNVFLGNILSSHALTNLKRIHYETVLRSDGRDSRLEVIGIIADMRQPEETTDFALRLVGLLDDGDAEVAVAAADGLAHIARRMRLSMETLAERKEPQRWERDLYQKLRRVAAEPLRKQFRQGSAAMKRATAGALGALEEEDAVDLFVLQLGRPQCDAATAEAIIVALGDMRSLFGLDPLVSVLAGDYPAAAQVKASWALGEIMASFEPQRPRSHPLADQELTREPYGIEKAVTYLGQRLFTLSDARVRCALVSGIRRFRDARFVRPLLDLFERADSTYECPREELARRHGAPELLSRPESIRMKVLDALAAMAVGNAEVRAWAERQSARGNFGTELQRQIDHLLELVRAKEGPR